MTEDAHLDLDTLAYYAEDLLDADRTAAVRAHLAGCPQCRANADRLLDVGRLLAETPSPPMPDRVATRIDDALSTAETRRRVTPLAKLQKRSSIWIGSAAAAVVAVLVVGGVIGGVRDTVTYEAGSAGQGADTGSGTASLHKHGGARAQGGRPPQEPKAAEAATSVTASGRHYSPARLSDQAVELVRAERSGVSVQMDRPTPRTLRTLAKPRRLAQCISRVTGSYGDNLLAVDLASYTGRPSAIIVASGKSSSSADVWVVDPSCSRVRAHTQLPETGK